MQKIIKLASAAGSIKDFTEKLIEEGEIETADANPELEASLLLARADSTHELAQNIAKSAKEQESLLKDISEFKYHIGFAGEHFAVGELLLQGINAMRTNVDSGYDIVAIGEDKVAHLIQVKTANRNDYDSYSFHINTGDSEDRVYIFVFLNKSEKNFIVISRKEVLLQEKAGNVWSIKSTSRFRFRFYLRDGKAYLGNLENDITNFLNNWSFFHVKKIPSNKKNLKA